MSDFLKVGIVADDKTGKGVKSAKKNISTLDSAVKNLGKTFVSVFAAQKIIQFTKLSVKAAAADEASAAKLATAVKNLGLEFANPYISDYIAKMEKQSKVADDELRPAFQTLITQTSSLAKSQELLATAINVSKGSGESLATVSNDLAQAFVGNTKGLKKYYLGLTNAELAATSFTDIQKLLNSQFAGASQQYLNTYQGQLDTLSLSFGNLQESAGRAFFTLIGGQGGSSGGAKTLAFWMDALGFGAERAAQNISDFFVRLGMSQNEFDAYIAKRSQPPAPVKGKELFLQSSSNNAAYLKLEKERLALAKKAADAAKKLTAEQKKQALLKKQGTLFDMEQIQLVAALQGKLSDEERKRVELQLALLNGNAEEAKRLSTEIANSIDKTGNLAKYLQTLPDAKNPFASWDAYLDAIEERMKKLNLNPINPSTPINPQNPPIPVAISPKDYSGFAQSTNLPSTSGSGAQFGSSTPWAIAAANSSPVVVVEFQGADSLSNALRDSFVSASMEGSFSQINRSVGAFDR